MYNTLVASILGRSPKGVPPPISSVEEFIFEVSTQPADNMITVVLDMQNESDYMGCESNTKPFQYKWMEIIHCVHHKCSRC